MKKLLIALLCIFFLSQSAQAASEGGILDLTPKLFEQIVEDFKKTLELDISKIGPTSAWSAEVDGKMAASLIFEERNGYVSRIQTVTRRVKTDKKNHDKYVALEAKMLMLTSVLITQAKLGEAVDLVKRLSGEQTPMIIDIGKSRIAMTVRANDENFVTFIDIIPVTPYMKY